MYREDIKKQSIININFLTDDGGIGDMIARTPALLYIYNHHPHVIMHIWVPTYFRPIIERMLPKDKKRIILRDYTEMKKFNSTLQARAFSPHKYTNLASHMTEHAFEVLCYQQVEDHHKNYITFDVSDVDVKKFNLPEKYVVIPPCFTSKTRIMLGAYINQIVAHCAAKGYTTVFLGNSRTETGGASIINANIDPQTDLTKGIDLINKTSLLEASRILKEASCVIGLDNGLLHLAACFETSIVYGFTTVKPIHRLPFRHNIKGWNVFPVVLTQEELPCYNCQSNMTFTYQHSFTTCFYANTEKAYECLLKLTPDKYIEQINKIL